MHLLVVEDDPVVGKSLHKGLEEARHECVWVKDGDRGLAEGLTQRFDAIILDLLLPGLPGLSVLRELRARGVRTPVILLTALGAVEERVAGLDAGADDYLVKPFAFAELAARLEAVCRRVLDRPAPLLCEGDLSLDLTTRRVQRGGNEIDLTPTEFSLLEMLMRHAGQVVTRKMLCEHLWEADWEGTTNLIEVHINRLRKKLDREGAGSVIQTVRGRGYAFGLLDRHTLRFRLTFWNTGAILLLVLATFVGLREGLRYTLERELDALLAEDLVEVKLALDRFYPDRAQLKDELDRKAVSHKARAWFVRVYKADGKLLLATTGAPGFTWPENTQGRPFNISTYRVLQQRLTWPDRPELVVRVGCSQDFVEDDVMNLSKMLVAAGCVFLVLAPLSGYWLAGRATRPLATILETTARLHPDQLDERVPVRGAGDELDRLAATINGLLDRLANHLRQQREFVANAAHELRSPLAALRASAEVALGRDRSPEEHRELLADIVEACDGLGGLVNQLLLLAEGEAGLPHTGSAVRLDQLAARSLDMFTGMAEEHGLELCSTLAPVTVRGHDTHLRQVINNLIDNAIKFTPSGGRVSVEVGPAGEGQAFLRVQDSGIGIAESDLPHVCERFYRADKSRQRVAGGRRPGGNGLGLSICEAIVRAHGGWLDIQSAPGQGTAVTVRLPEAGPSPRRPLARITNLETMSG